MKFWCVFFCYVAFFEYRIFAPFHLFWVIYTVSCIDFDIGNIDLLDEHEKNNSNNCIDAVLYSCCNENIMA